MIKLVLLSSMFCFYGLAQTGKITIKVIDGSSGQVISNVNVYAGFNTYKESGWGWGDGGRTISESGFTDESGMCTLSANHNEPYVAYGARKENYYGSGGYRFTFTNTTGIVRKRWEPWNPTLTVPLKKIGNPVPMYVKRVWDINLDDGKPRGYDLEIGDWVAPHGKGKVKDFVFQLKRKPDRVVDIPKVGLYGKTKRLLYDVSLKVEMGCPEDGFILHQIPHVRYGSRLRLPRYAPENGYTVSSIEKRAYNSIKNPEQSNVSKDANYFFRVRTKKDEKGNIISALYGKIHGDFGLQGYDRKVSFGYYLNPTPNDRNMEFDPEQNLFKGKEFRHNKFAP